MTKAKTKGPKAEIAAKAKLVNVKSVAGETHNGDHLNGYEKSQGTALEVTLRIDMGYAQTLPAWDEWKRREGAWRRRDFIESGIRKLNPKPAKAKKPSKSKQGTPPAEEAPPPLTQAFDEKAERMRLSDEFDAQLRVKYEKRVDQVNAQNARYLQRATAMAMFLAPRRSRWRSHRCSRASGACSARSPRCSASRSRSRRSRTRTTTTTSMTAGTTKMAMTMRHDIRLGWRFAWCPAPACNGYAAGNQDIGLMLAMHVGRVHPELLYDDRELMRQRIERKYAKPGAMN